MSIFKIFIIFVLSVTICYASNTNLKNPQCRCNYLLGACVDRPSALGLFIMKPYENLSLEDMEGEIWKDIPGWENKFKASNLGRIKSLQRKIQRSFHSSFIAKERIRKQFESKSGYLKITLSNTNRSKTVHRLIILTFSGDSPLHVDHINGIKNDNRIENLEYVTQRENNVRARKISGSRKLPLGVVQINGKYVAKIYHNYKVICLGTFDTPTEAALKYEKASSDLNNLHLYKSVMPKSQYGKFIYKNGDKYIVRVRINKKLTSIGTFKNIEDARIKLQQHLLQKT